MKKLLLLISTGLLSITMISNSFALEINLSSYSLDDLKILAKQINIKIQELEKNKAQNCFVSNSDLSLGDGEGGVLTNDVRKLQDFLREKRFFQYKSTGYFGKLTKTALISYQTSIGVTGSGEFDAATREKAHSGQCSSNKKYDDDKDKQEYLKKEKIMEEEKKKAEYYKEEEKRKAELYKKENSYNNSQVQSISLTSNGNIVSWVTSGNSQYGYKVTWSKSPNPTYPPRDYDKAEYYSDPNVTKATISDFSGNGKYYVRVCEYLNGKCGVYSNEIILDIQ